MNLLKNLQHTGYDCGFKESGALTIATSEAENDYLKSIYQQDYCVNNYDIKLIESNKALFFLEPLHCTVRLVAMWNRC